MPFQTLNFGQLLAPGVADESAGTFDLGRRRNTFANPLDILQGPKPDQSPADFEQGILSMLAPTDIISALLFKNKPEISPLRLLGVTSGDTQTAQQRAGAPFTFPQFNR